MTDEALERRARRLVELDVDAASPRGIVLREVRLTLALLDRARTMYALVAAQLDEAIGRLGSEVLQVERLYTRAAPLRTDLLGKLLVLEAERRRVRVQREQDLRGLHQQLVVLVNKLTFLDAG